MKNRRATSRKYKLSVTNVFILFFLVNNINTGVNDNLYFLIVVHISQQGVMCKEKDEGTYRINMTEFSKKLCRKCLRHKIKISLKQKQYLT